MTITLYGKGDDADVNSKILLWGGHLNYLDVTNVISAVTLTGGQQESERERKHCDDGRRDRSYVL